MSATCQVCAAKAPNAFLCARCQTELRQMLEDCPWWLDRLAEAAVGHAKLGDVGRHTRAASGGLVEYTDPIEGDERLERDIAVGKFKRDRVLAAGRVNARASRLLDQIQNSLTTIVRDLCETRGVPVLSVRAVAPSFIGPLLPNDIRGIYRSGAHLSAAWLSERITAIAAGEGAGQTFLEIRRFMGDERHDGEIGKVINRPIPMRTLGKCPTWIEDKRMACGVELRCRQGDVEVYCRGCRRTHNPDRLQLLLMKDLERKKITFDKILKANRIQPEEYQVPERTLRWWRQESKLKPRGYRRPDGREVITRHSDDDVPLYLWDDVRKLRTEKPERKKAG